MPLGRVGIITDTGAANASAFPRVELNAYASVAASSIYVTEVGISHNAAANSTVVPVDYQLYRNTLVATGTTATIEALRASDTIITTGLVECSAQGAGTIDLMHKWYVPVVSGMIWVAAPGREIDCPAASFIGVENQGALGASINANVYMIFEE
jgi:hypothetical protein